MTADIHPTATVDPAASLGEGVRIGPYCLVGPRVVLGAGSILESHVVVTGPTTIGERAHIFPFAVVGQIPQDLKYHGEDSTLVIGDDVRIREHVTIHLGTEGGGMVTRIGNGCLIMVGAHIAHDCLLGDRCIIVNNVLLGGHVTVGDHAIVGGGSAVHQFVRIGQHAMIGGMTGVEQDVIPYGLAMGDRGFLAGLNLVGLRRRGFDREATSTLRAAFKELFEGEGQLTDRVAGLRETYGDQPVVAELLAFLSDSDRKILKPKAGHDG